MKRYLLIFVAVTLAGLVFFNQSTAQCPQDPNDNGVCDTLYLQAWPADIIVNPPGPFLVRVPIFVTHDVPDPAIDSIAGFLIPLCYHHYNSPSLYCSLTHYWNANVLGGPSVARSIFRHLPSMSDPQVHNWMMDQYEEGNGEEWNTIVLDLDGTSHFWLQMIPSGTEDQKWGQGSRVLLATMTFRLEDTMEVCIDTCLLPPTGHLAFTNGIGTFYTPTWGGPYCYTTKWPYYPTYLYVAPTYAGSPCCWQLDLSQSTHSVAIPLVKVIAKVFDPSVTVESAIGPTGAQIPVIDNNSNPCTITYFMPPGISLMDGSQTVYACFNGVGPLGVYVSFTGYDEDDNPFETNKPIPKMGKKGECACFHPPKTMSLWLPFDDESGPKAKNLRSYYDGIHYNGSAVATPGNGPEVKWGLVNRALYFDGSDDHVDVPGNNGYCNTYAGNFTIDAWIYGKVNGTRTIVDKRQVVNSYVTGYQFFLYEGQLGLQLACGSAGNCSWMVLPEYALLEDNLYHVAVTVDRNSSTGIVFYINGLPCGSFNPILFQGLSIGNNSVFRIGGNVPSPLGGGYFEGQIDEVELFRRALTPTEIKGIYDADYYGKCKWTFHPPPEYTTLEHLTASGVLINSSVIPQTFNYSFAGLPYGDVPGPTTFTPSSGSITLEPLECAKVEVTIELPEGMQPGQVIFYDMIVEDSLGTSHGVSMVRMCDSWCASFSSGYAEALVDSVMNLGPVTVTNASDTDDTLYYRIIAMMDEDNPDSEIISLNDMPPGSAISDSVLLSPGESIQIPLTGKFIDYSPLSPYIIAIQSYGEGEWQTLNSMYVINLPEPCCNDFVMIRDCENDIGTEPNPDCPVWWESPDIYISNYIDSPNDLQDLPLPGVDNNLYFVVTNHTADPVFIQDGVVAGMYNDAAMGTSPFYYYCGNMAPLLGWINPGQRKRALVVWHVLPDADPQSPQYKHYCIGALVSVPGLGDHPESFDILKENNLAQVNMYALYQRAGQNVPKSHPNNQLWPIGPTVFRSMIKGCNPTDVVGTFVPVFDSTTLSQLPAGWTVTFADGGPFWLEPDSCIDLEVTLVASDPQHNDSAIVSTYFARQDDPSEVVGGATFAYYIDEYPPVPVEDLEAMALSGDDTTVRLSWTRPSTDITGGVERIRGYYIFSDTVPINTGSAAIDTVAIDAEPELAGFQWYDTRSRGSNEKRYYRVSSIDGSYIVSEMSNEVSIQLGCCQGKVLIPNTEECVNPGDYVTLPILLKNNPVPFGGFELEVEFDYTAMTFVGAEMGELLTDLDSLDVGPPPKHYSWEYFQYRMLPCPLCGCCKYKILLLGMMDLPNGSNNVGVPIPENSDGELVLLHFVVNNDENLRGLKIPVCWEWEGTVVNDTLVEDWDCNENTFSSWTGDTLFVSKLLCQYRDSLCDAPTGGIELVLIFQNGICGQNCGGVDVCPAGPGFCKRGDVNYNTMPYEVADAVLFASYFAQGIGVFPDSTRAYQICATDVNADGRSLTLSDLVYLIRVILHDAPELHKLTPSSDIVNVTVSGNTITTECAGSIGAILFEFDGAVVPTLLADKMEMIAKDNKVLVWSREGQSLESTAKVVSFEGDANLTSVTAVDRDSRELKTSFVGKTAPVNFALHPAYPNPFNPYTNLSFSLPEALSYSLKIYNVTGQLVRSYEGMGKAGLNVITWDSKDNAGDEVASGIYFYQFTAGSFSATRKMVVVK